VPPKASLRLPQQIKTGATSVEATFTASDNCGLRAMVFVDPENPKNQGSIVAGRALTGRWQSFKEVLTVRPVKRGQFKLEALVTDVGGNMTRVTAQCAVID
jgi:hypothetical protein